MLNLQIEHYMLTNKPNPDNGGVPPLLALHRGMIVPVSELSIFQSVTLEWLRTTASMTVAGALVGGLETKFKPGPAKPSKTWKDGSKFVPTDKVVEKLLGCL